MSKNNDLVSVVMPAYNCENYITNAIESVLKQTYSNFELIVIDDGSKDNTLKIINDYGKKDYRVKVFRNKKNSGVSATRNRGISLAEGEWIAFLDSDDIWIEDKLEKQMNCVYAQNAEFVFTGVSYIDETGKSYSGIFEVPNEVSYKKLLRQNVITCSSVLVNKRYFENIRMEKDDMHEDYAVWLRILRLGVTAYSVNEPLLIYRISRNSKSGNKLKTIKMTYKVFRFIGINSVGSVYFMMQHVFRSVIKYKKIKVKNVYKLS
ncbi:MAG: glycosyltransferase [Epulopiscium sp.]|nr:glycosyltransferase [Candidatus Epulonipiscium sp.]